MQLWGGADLRVRFLDAFSILGRIGGDATSCPAAEVRYYSSTFSILGRIGGDATDPDAVPYTSMDELSVSSVGSEAMQRLNPAYISRWVSYFQYPRSDRRRCNER